MTRLLRAEAVLCPGAGTGATLALDEPLSFWGGFDARSGLVLDRFHPQRGQCLSGRVLVMTAGRGSSSGSSVLAESLRLGAGPAGVVLAARDAVIAVGALVAAELYGRACPVVLARADDWYAIRAAPRLAIRAAGGEATLRLG